MTLYLVRLLQGFRFPLSTQWGQWRRSPHAPIQATFSTRTGAEQFMAENVPIFQNPFDTRAMLIRPDGIHTWQWDEDLYDPANPDADKHDVSWKSFLKAVDALGLSRPELPSSLQRLAGLPVLAQWWDTTPMTDAQKTTLWQLLHPHPYRIDEIELS